MDEKNRSIDNHMLQFALGLRRKIGFWLNGRTVVQPHSFSGPVAEKKSVLVVCDLDADQDRQSVSALKAEMKKLCPKATVSVACYFKKDSKTALNVISDDDVLYFSEDVLSFFFKFKDTDLLDFLQKDYDVAAFLSKSGNVVTDFASQYVKAGLRVGWANSELDKNGLLNFCVSSKHGHECTVKDVVDSIKMVFA